MSTLKNLKLAKIIRSSLSLFRNNIHWILLILLIDLLFIFILSITMTFIQISALGHLTAVMEMGGQATGGVANMYETPDTVMYGIQNLSMDEQFQFHIKRLLLYLGLMVLVGYVLWVLFQGVSWWLSHRLCIKKPQSYLRYLKNFSLQSLFFYLGFVFLTYLWVRAFLAVKMSITPWLGGSTVSFTFGLLMIVWWYFGFFSYTMVNRQSYRNIKQSFVFGVKKIIGTIQTIAFLTLLFLILDLILFIPWLVQHTLLFTIIGIAFLMPALAFSRIMFFETRKMYWPAIHPHRKAKHKKSSHKQHDR